VDLAPSILQLTAPSPTVFRVFFTSLSPSSKSLISLQYTRWSFFFLCIPSLKTIKFLVHSSTPPRHLAGTNNVRRFIVYVRSNSRTRTVGKLSRISANSGIGPRTQGVPRTNSGLSAFSLYSIIVIRNFLLLCLESRLLQ